MSIVDLLRDSEKDHPIRSFATYEILDKGGQSGQQGIVKRARNAIGKIFAIKFLRPTSLDPLIRAVAEESFKREIRILAQLHHRNIARIISGGSAVWHETESTWQIYEGFEDVTTGEEHATSEILFYLMDFIDDDLENVFGPLHAQDAAAKPDLDPLPERTRQFEELASQVCLAVEHFHTKTVTHKDIKIDNIRYAPDDGSFIVVDFGFARHLDSTSRTPEMLVIKEEQDPVAELGHEYVKVDIAQLAGVLGRVFATVAAQYDRDRIKGIERVLSKARQPNVDKRFETVRDFYDALRPFFLHLGRAHLPFVLRLNEFLTPSLFGKFSSRLRIPVSGSILLTQEVRRIIDAPEFQRLRGVKQLGPTEYVFPGATHSRFEHSLGVYWLALRYLERICRQPNFRARHDDQEECIKLVALSALLHDIGHYPFSHWIEELGLPPSQFPSHEQRAREIINDSKIGALVKNEWGIDPNDVAGIIDDVHMPEEYTVLNSILNSPIDVDKLDYLVRDSIHCGVPYGRGIDVDRLLDSLYVHAEEGQICLTDKGQSAFISVLGARNIMYQEVYWHKTVRACQAMFKRFFFEFVSKPVKPLSEVRTQLMGRDDSFLHYLFKAVGARSRLRPLVAPFVSGPRQIYKLAFVYSSRTRQPAPIRKFFEGLIGTKNYGAIAAKSDLVAKELKIPPLELLLEVPPVKSGERYALENFKLVDHRSLARGSVATTAPGASITGLNDYLLENQRAFVFCASRHADKLSKLTRQEWKGIFESVLG